MMKVLIADNSELVLARLRERLTEFGDPGMISVAKDGWEALDKMESVNPGLAIIDLDMPGLNGFEVLKKIRKTNQETTIIILTLHSSIYYREKAFWLGANYFFSKVDDFENILVVARNMILSKPYN